MRRSCCPSVEVRRGRRSHPSPAPLYPQEVGWLAHLKGVSQPSAEPPKPPLGARSGTASTGAGRERAFRLLGRQPSRTARTVPRCSLPGHRILRPIHDPTGTGDRRSHADPTARTGSVSPTGSPQSAIDNRPRQGRSTTTGQRTLRAIGPIPYLRRVTSTLASGSASVSLPFNSFSLRSGLVPGQKRPLSAPHRGQRRSVFASKYQPSPRREAVDSQAPHSHARACVEDDSHHAKPREPRFADGEVTHVGERVLRVYDHS